MNCMNCMNSVESLLDTLFTLQPATAVVNLLAPLPLVAPGTHFRLFSSYTSNNPRKYLTLFQIRQVTVDEARPTTKRRQPQG